MTRSARPPASLDVAKLTLNDPPRLVWLRLADAFELLWPDNPKLHDTEGIIASIERYGLQELPKFDATLSAIKAGNGRIEALRAMERRGTYSLPRGCALDGEDRWCLPVVFGTDARSAAAARAYAVDSNNLTLLGGAFTGEDLSRLWDPAGYSELLIAMQADDVFAVSVPAADIEDVLAALGRVPDFEPASAEAQSRLDQRNPVTCPACHHVFTPTR